MPRPRKTRFIQGDTTVRYYKPQGIPLEGLIETDLSLDGLEALRLADAEGLEQDAAAHRIGDFPFDFFPRLLGEARGAVATALTRGWAIRIDGGPVTVVPEVEGETPYGRRRAHCVRRAAAAALTEQLHQEAALENSQAASAGNHDGSRASSGSPSTSSSTDGKTMNTVIAVPSMSPGGLESEVSAHFGHCEAFTLVALRDGKVEKTTVLTPPSHEHGGCLAPIGLLASSGVTAIAAGGMGRRPLQGFLQTGIQPYFAAEYKTVGEVVSAFLAGALVPFGAELVCGGGEDCHEH